MRATLRIIAALALCAAACGAAPSPSPSERPTASAPRLSPYAPPQEAGRAVGVWQAPAGLVQAPIWPGAAPDMAGWKVGEESVLTAETPEAVGGRFSQAVFDVSVPTMTVFPARGTPTGAAVIVFPGGGFNAVVLTVGGTEICDWLTARGVTCILSKYRVPGSNHHRDPTCDCGVTPDVPRALQDAQRTIRLVRSRAGELGVDPNRIGVMGFSAGGYLVAQTSNIFEPTYRPVDAVDRISSRPDFAVAVYPGHLCRDGGALDPGIRPTGRTPPTFIAQTWDDEVDPVCNSLVYARALDRAGVSTELHLFAEGGHNFGLRHASDPVGAWAPLVETWLERRGVLRPR